MMQTNHPDLAVQTIKNFSTFATALYIVTFKESTVHIMPNLDQAAANPLELS